MRVLGENPYTIRRILMWSSETQIPRLTTESSTREEMVRRQVQRNSMATTMSRDAFLAQLQCSLRLGVLTTRDDKHFGRCFELINKTNQFNTTGQRWTAVDIDQFLKDGGRIVYFHVSDKFVDYGLVGVVLIRGAQIVQYVMSCRVLGLGVEQAAIVEIARLCRAAGGGELVAEIIETTHNAPCRQLYTQSGFQQASKGRFVLPSGTAPTPSKYVTVVLEPA